MSQRRPITPGDSKRRRRSLRVQLLVTVNAVAFAGLAVWLLQDYRRELTDQLASTRAALTNEARVLAPLLAHLHDSQPTAMQARIDEVCMSMRTEDSPEHHIVVQVNGTVYESAPHPENDDGSAGQHHPASKGRWENTAQDPPISGSYQAAGLNVEVSKSAKVVMGEVRRRAVGRLLITAAGVLVVALIANLVIVRLVNRPLARLVAVVREIGAGALGLAPGRFDTAELDFLASEIGNMSLSLAAVEKDRRAQLAKARQLQEHLSPSPDKLAGLEFVAAYMPADNIAGDYYDALPLPHARDDAGPTFILCLADVCGHGVPAAMGAAMLKTLLLDACDRTSDPAEVLSYVNRRFADVSLPGDFASMFVAALRPGADDLAYASAGHEYCYLVGSAGRVCPLAATGMLVGIDSQGKWETSRVPVNAGDRLLLVSVGVTEAVDTQGRLFGREHLAELLRDAPADLQGLLGAVRGALSNHTRNTPLRDDVTIVVAGLDRRRTALSDPPADDTASVPAGSTRDKEPLERRAASSNAEPRLSDRSIRRPRTLRSAAFRFPRARPLFGADHGRNQAPEASNSCGKRTWAGDSQPDGEIGFGTRRSTSMKSRGGWRSLSLVVPLWLAACDQGNESADSHSMGPGGPGNLAIADVGLGFDAGCSDDPVLFTSCEAPMTHQRDLEVSSATLLMPSAESSIVSASWQVGCTKHVPGCGTVESNRQPNHSTVRLELADDSSRATLVRPSPVKLSSSASSAQENCGCGAQCTCG